MDSMQLAALKAGKHPVESETGSSSATLRVGVPQKVSGIAESDSADGYVMVDLGGSSVTEDDYQAIEMPTDVPVKAGDEVSVEIVDGKPRVVGRIGWGDELQSVADEALEVAQATGQYFWHDDNGAHVSTEALNPTGPSNSLWNSLGLLIRKAANNLVSITQSAIAFYDGNGNNSANVIASFGSTGAQIGKAAANHIEIDSDSIDLCDGSTAVATIENGTTAAGMNIYTSGFVKGGKSESALWIHGNDRVSIGTQASQPTKEQIQIASGAVSLRSGYAADAVSFELGDTKATSGNITGRTFNGFRGRRNIASTENIDDLRETGMYYIGSASPSGTLPSGMSTYFNLISIGSATSGDNSTSWVGKQVAVSGAGMAWRSYSGSPRSWSAWHKLLDDTTNQTTTVVNNANETIKVYGRMVMVQIHGRSKAPDGTSIWSTAYLANYKPAYNISTVVAATTGELARMWVSANDGKVYLSAVNTSSSFAWYGTLTYIY